MSSVTTISAFAHCFVIPIVDNNIYDIGGRDFSASLSSSDAAVRVDSRTVTIHIVENDGE